MTQNIKSIKKSYSELITFLFRTKMDWDLVILTECWLPRNSNILVINGYYYRYTKNAKTQNEGVIVYSHSNHKYTISEPSLDDANCLLIKISRYTVLLTIYRPPGMRCIQIFLQSLNDFLVTLSSCRNIILTGDINIDRMVSSTDTRAETYLVL